MLVNLRQERAAFGYGKGGPNWRKSKILVSFMLSLHFFLISQNIYKKAQRGATQSTQEVYKGSLRGGGGGEVIKKI
jgi:hypothetical protein